RKIPNLKCFNLSCFLETFSYDTLIVPLLHRMLNLEKLGLYIMTYVKERFIDGNSLKEDILYHLTKMKHFDFDIYSNIYMENQLNFPSKEDIQQTFKDFPCTKVISCVDYIHKRKQVQCHVYSYPFLMEFYEQITNNFPGGFYPYVRIVSLYDVHPFEHEFFLQISLAFPLMGRLTLFNYCSQNVKQSIDINQNFEIIRYYHLIELDIRQCHDDYTEEFLLHTKTYLHNSISLDIDLESLARITQNFTRNETRINCSKNLPLPLRIDFSCYIDRDKATYANLTKHILNDASASLSVLGACDIYGVAETYCFIDDTQRKKYGQAFTLEALFNPHC
ncbi:unnamed protein product, partial [Rotaria sp. Silwood1]